MNTIIVKLDDQTYEVSKLPIGKYPEVIALGRSIFAYFSKFENIDNQTIINELPALIEENIPTFIKLLSITTPAKEEDLKDYGLFEFVELTMAVVEVNKYVDIYNRIKKGLARPANPIGNLTKENGSGK